MTHIADPNDRHHLRHRHHQIFHLCDQQNTFHATQESSATLSCMLQTEQYSIRDGHDTLPFHVFEALHRTNQQYASCSCLACESLLTQGRIASTLKKWSLRAQQRPIHTLTHHFTNETHSTLAKTSLKICIYGEGPVSQWRSLHSALSCCLSIVPLPE